MSLSSCRQCGLAHGQYTHCQDAPSIRPTGGIGSRVTGAEPRVISREDVISTRPWTDEEKAAHPNL